MNNVCQLISILATFSALSQVKMHCKINEENLTLNAGEVILVEKGNTVQYANPYNVESEYGAVCLPAFSPELANRDL